MAAIEVKSLSRLYNSHIAVDSISFEVPSNTIFGLLGPNGAGKSTTIKMLTTLLPPTSGTAIIDGYDIIKNPRDVRQNIGYVPQLVSADGELTANESLILSAKLYGLPKAKWKQRIPEVLEFMGLTAYADQLVNQYSGGMVRRLEIAQSLVHTPNVLFLDEPTVGLDPGARKTLWKCIQDLCREYKTTILLTTHDMDEADILCETVAFMYQGHIVAMDSPANFKAQLGSTASLDDVFIHHTGSSITERGNYHDAKQNRRAIINRD